MLTLPIMTTSRYLMMLLIMSSLKKIDFMLVNEAFIFETNMCGAYDSKYKKDKSKGPKYDKKGIKASSSGYKRKRGKHDGKKGKNIDCLNCGKPGHFASDCSEPNVIFNHNNPSNLYVSS